MTEQQYLAAQHNAESAPWQWVALMFAVIFIGPFVVVQIDKRRQSIKRQQRTCARHEIDRAMRRVATREVGAANGVREFEWADNLDIDWGSR